jgi:hypothetical protein
VRRYVRGWQRDQTATSVGAFVPLRFALGEAYQFDWSHEIVLINGTTVTVKVAHVRLCHSRMLFARAYPRESSSKAHAREHCHVNFGLANWRIGLLPCAHQAACWTHVS